MTTASRRLAVVPSRPKIVSPYLRVSALMGRGEDDEAFRSPDIQLRAIRKDLELIGAVEGPVLMDIDKTGRDFNREGIQRVFALKAAGEIDGVAVYDVSRLGRTAGETLAAIDKIRENDGVFTSAHEKFGTGPESDWMMLAFVGFAQLYSDRIAIGWRNVIEQRAENGLHNGTPPTGYRFERDDHGKPTAIVPDDSAAPKVAEAFKRYAAGASATSISEWLYREGVFRGTNVKRMLSNPFYAGKLRLWAYAGKAKKRTRLPGVPPRILDGRHAPIVTDEVWQAVQDRIERERYTAKRYIDPTHPLAGLVVCECRRALVHQIGRGGGEPYYRCQNGRRAGCRGCGGPRVIEVVAAVFADLERQMAGFTIGGGDHAARMEVAAAVTEDRARRERELALLTSALTDLDADYYSGAIVDRDRYKRAEAALNGRIAKAKSALAALPVVDVPDVPALVDAWQRLRDTWDDPSVSNGERAVLLRNCGLRRVILRAATRWREPVADRTRVEWSIGAS